MHNEELHQKITRQLSALSEEQTDALWAYLQELSADGTAQKNGEKYLTFSCCEQTFGIHIRQVIQILRILPITPIPESLPYMKGVITVRGEILPVIDLRVRLGREAEIDPRRNCIVIIHAQGRSVGMIVDSICSVETILLEEICPPPRQEDLRAGYLTGIVKRDTVILLADPDGLFAVQDLDSVLALSGVQDIPTQEP